MRTIGLILMMLVMGACAQTANTADQDVVKVAAPPPTAIPAPPPPALPDTAGFALLRSLLASHFNGEQRMVATTCATIRGGSDGGALKDGDEAALMASFPELAPLDRCVWRDSHYVDAITGGDAMVFDVHDLRCTKPDDCTAMGGWTAANLGAEYTQYRVRRVGGEWQITSTGVRIMS